MSRPFYTLRGRARYICSLAMTVYIFVIPEEILQNFKMPDVVGQHIERVRKDSFVLRLQLRIETEPDYRCDLEPGVVTRQSPQAGATIRAGATVRLWVAGECVIVPNVEQSHVGAAQSILGSKKLRFDTIAMATASAEPDTVLKQSPPAGTRVPPGTVVHLTIAKLKMVEVPDVRERPVEEAKRLLESRGLIAVMTEPMMRPGRRPLIVVSQIPAAGEMVASGTLVRLTVSSPQAFQMPDLVGQQIRGVRQHPDVLQLQLRIETEADYFSDLEPGLVTRQSPLPGTNIQIGATVKLWVARAQESRPMPNLVGQTLEETKRRPDLETFRVMIETEDDPESDFRPGIVSRQDPSPGTTMQLRMRVKLWVATRRYGGTNLALLIIGLLAAAGAGYFVLSLARKAVKPSKAPSPEIRFRSATGQPEQHIWIMDRLLADYELRLRPRTDRGTQKLEVTGNLVKEERRWQEW